MAESIHANKLRALGFRKYHEPRGTERTMVFSYLTFDFGNGAQPDQETLVVDEIGQWWLADARINMQPHGFVNETKKLFEDALRKYF